MEHTDTSTVGDMADEGVAIEPIDAEALLILDFASTAGTAEASTGEASVSSPQDPEEGNIDPDDQLTACEALLSLVNAPGVSSTTASPLCSAETDALNHFERLMQACVCRPSCRQDSLATIAIKFKTFNEAERVGFMSNMLFATATGRATAEGKGRTTIGYYIKGIKLCRPAFAAVLQLAEKTVQHRAKIVAEAAVPELYTTRHAQSTKGRHGVQKVIVAAFLHNYAARNSMECPRGRGAQEEAPLRLLPSDTSKVDVHRLYTIDWPEIACGLQSLVTLQKAPESAISYNLFNRYWKELMPTLRIASSGSDFCDTCTTLKSTMEMFEAGDPRYDSSQIYLSSHREHAKTEFEVYKQCQTEAIASETNETRHLVFDFAEKVLLPRLQKQPGQLHFITGLKFDIFRVSCSNMSTNYIFGLPEGHWPNEKTANVVISMLHYVLEDLGVDEKPTSFSRVLQLHADNCSGQNKNRFVLWYLAWRVIMGFDDRITLFFLVSGHTINVCDGSFGHVKRKLRISEAVTPAHMMRIIEDSSRTTRCIPSDLVLWKNWKQYLGQFFTVPATLNTSVQHVFEFNKEFTGKVQVKEYTTSTGHASFGLLKRGVAAVTVQMNWIAEQNGGLYNSVITPLENVPSPQQSRRKNYLSVNILDKYYRNNTEIRQKYFESGADALGEAFNGAI